jgi:hypothetical protein
VGDDWSTSRPCRFTPGERASGTDWIGGLVDSRAGLDDTKWKFLPSPGLEHRPLRRPARNQSLYRLRYPGSSKRGDNIEKNSQVWTSCPVQDQGTWPRYYGRYKELSDLIKGNLLSMWVTTSFWRQPLGCVVSNWKKQVKRSEKKAKFKMGVQLSRRACCSSENEDVREKNSLMHLGLVGTWERCWSRHLDTSVSSGKATPTQRFFGQIHIATRDWHVPVPVRHNIRVNACVSLLQWF